MKILYPTGIEIETCVPNSFEPEKLKHWSTAGDCSIRIYKSTYTSMEFRSTILKNKKQIFTALQEITTIAQEDRFEPNDTCGTHIHIGIYDKWDKHASQSIKIKKLLLLYLKIEPYFFMTTTMQRLNSPYCKPMNAFFQQQNIHLLSADIINLLYGARTYKTNIKKYIYNHGASISLGRPALHFSSRHNTIEFRLFHGSFDFKTVYSWIMLCHALIGTASRLSLKDILNLQITNSEQVFKEILCLPEDVITHLKYLTQQFMPLDNEQAKLDFIVSKITSSRSYLHRDISNIGHQYKQIRNSILQSLHDHQYQYIKYNKHLLNFMIARSIATGKRNLTLIPSEMDFIIRTIGGNDAHHHIESN